MSSLATRVLELKFLCKFGGSDFGYNQRMIRILSARILANDY